MANPEHIEILKQGVDAWNSWRNANPELRPDLSKANLMQMHLLNVDFHGADLSDAKLSHADLTGARLRKAKLCGAWLYFAKLSGAKLPGADLSRAHLIEAQLTRTDLLGVNLEHAFIRKAELQGANLHGAYLMFSDMSDSDFTDADLTDAKLNGANVCNADLTRADLTKVDLSDADFSEATLYKANLTQATISHTNFFRADLTRAILRRANLKEVNLTYARLIETELDGAMLHGCYVYGISAWNLQGKPDSQSYFTITPYNESAVMVDDIEVAQFIYLLLNREKIRNVINAVTRKGVLLLGRFEDGGLALLQTIAAWLRRPENGGYLPLLFDFPRPESKTYTETIRTLAGLARFVIVDLSGPSVPQEITAVVDLHEIPFVPILDQERKDWSMFKDFLVKERVLKLISFADQNQLLKILTKKAIVPAEKFVRKRQKGLEKIFGRA